MTIETQRWIGTTLDAGPVIDAIGTLGPAGTSSEQTALYLWGAYGADTAPRIQLHDTYEQAGEALCEGAVSHVLVANAYAGVHSFYMDPKLCLAGAFVLDTPNYGIAIAPGHTLPQRPRVATHPAPVPLLAELLPRELEVDEIVYASSTSAAARMAEHHETDLALTTRPAAEVHQLTFISRTRPIRMLWSVFTIADRPAQGEPSDSPL